MEQAASPPDPKKTHNDPFANDYGVTLLLTIIGAIMQKYGHSEFVSDLSTLEEIRKETIVAMQEYANGAVAIRLASRPGSIVSPLRSGLVRPNLVLNKINGSKG